MSELDSPIEFLKGVGPARAELLRSELNIRTFRDLLHYYPFRHIDRSKFYSIREIDPDSALVQVKGKFLHLDAIGANRATRMVGAFQDEHGELMEVVWFRGITWLKKSLKENVPYVIFGKPGLYKGKIQMSHPEVESMESFDRPLKGRLEGVYSTTEKLKARKVDSRTIRKLVEALIPAVEPFMSESLPETLRKKYDLLSRRHALKSIHFPATTDELAQAQKTLKFEELFYVQLRLIQVKAQRDKTIKGNVFNHVGHAFNSFYNDHLPFPLTGAQKRVIKEVRRDVGSGQQMNRLLQGDVGSGKTIVALLCGLIAIDNGFQVALMAPTEILAQQHFETISELVENLEVEVSILTGSSKTAYRKELHERLENGQINILIGTHALLEDKVKFKNLGFVIIDEQHRFGVAQRSRLWKKSINPPHILVMTATPIPRTLAMTVYGDLDVSVIDELPPGRKPIKTVHRRDKDRLQVFGFMKDEIKKGRQVYIVYPLIEESQKLDYKDLMDGYESICRAFAQPEYQVAIVHGKMKPEDKDFEMKRFASGQCQIMVATTVIEVGVNVPNATVMIIESAERFGLSQLHQLRGRVGRGADQSFCILMTGHKLSNEGRVRMKTMVETNDGFVISEVDLKLRGPGDIMGTQQSGSLGFQIADILKDTDLLELARKEAFSIIDGRSEMSKQELDIVRNRLKIVMKRLPNWARIS
ncbi:MAG: ATP-dependent DNA helicase RecG [Flavobacteriales bacterium]|nr:ATP-dependent DNA helicase RecG [Flavobacteriales bacterium]MBT4705127.1 ATP-dependent DNA helicase RecG [Flavobacteriales bacterium]MBT4930147.1 ATP-dependent DNA helicase RecG [Flavobacteriales bacterium]MBT5133105.1 ATP-dependent DNA helicase RecG [Flavobacteriales bacterium]MBT5976914.1 ATP-dependent DNA helicase RecG [Flavobacteriales bacterium]